VSKKDPTDYQVTWSALHQAEADAEEARWDDDDYPSFDEASDDATCPECFNLMVEGSAHCCPQLEEDEHSPHV